MSPRSRFLLSWNRLSPAEQGAHGYHRYFPRGHRGWVLRDDVLA